MAAAQFLTDEERHRELRRLDDCLFFLENILESRGERARLSAREAAAVAGRMPSIVPNQLAFHALNAVFAEQERFVLRVEIDRRAKPQRPRARVGFDPIAPWRS